VNSINTVTGPLPADKLGRTLPHEHVFIDHMLDNWMGSNLLNDAVVAERELTVAHNAGVVTLVDQTGRGVHRDPLALKALSEKTGLNIVTGTGWFKERFYDLDFAKTNADKLTEIMVRDITEGIDDTGVRAGIIGEINVHNRWVTPGEERMHRAAARAQGATGLALAITGTHTSTAMEQLDILTEERADLTRVIVDHVNGIADHALHAAIAGRGPFTCFNTFPLSSPDLLDRDARLIKAMIDAGLIGHILVSTGVSVKKHMSAYGGGGYAFAVSQFRERIKAAGVSAQAWETITVENPRRALAGE
jgi:predicted metal-dependent phosphotriesterase family hydrolase